jgi:hypothetical protein
MTDGMDKLLGDTPIGASKLIAKDTYAVNAPFRGFPNVVYVLAGGGRWALSDTEVSETPQASIGRVLEEHDRYESLELVLGTHGHVGQIIG